MLTKQDYANIAALLGRVQYNGIQEAAEGVRLFSLLQQLAKDEQVETPSGNSSDNP